MGTTITTTTIYGLIISISSSCCCSISSSFSCCSILISRSSNNKKTPTPNRSSTTSSSSSYFPNNNYSFYPSSNNHRSSSLSLSSSSSSKQPIIIIRRRRIRKNIVMMPTPPTLLQLEIKAAASASSSSDGSDSGLVVGPNDLLIIGPGVLGRLVALQWKQDHPGCQIYGQTVTTDHHDELIRMGISPSLKGLKSAQKFPYVLFCAPPYQTTDYPADIREAALSWNGEGSFLFTSSSAPYDCYDNGQCYEDSPIVPIGKSPRTDVLLKAEKVVLESGGCVLRLAGLYKEGKGAHVYWLEKGNVDARPDLILNLIHYEDAASLSIAIMEKKLRGRIFLGCDNHPLSRQEIMDLVSKSGKFNKKFGSFTGTNDPLGKKLNNEKTRKEIGWEPKYPSFAYFLGVAQ